jgi:Alr-MurF fusion protein
LNFTVSEIASKTQLEAWGKTDNVFSELCIDSRSVAVPSQTLFIAIRTARNDGHKFIDELYKNGVRCFLVSDTKFIFKKYPDAGFLLAENTIEGLQKIAATKRKSFRKPVIGITGSNGKTVVKEWLSVLLAEKEVVCKNPKSFNSQVGVPLSVWGLKSENSLGVFEAGISQPGEMERLERIIKPTHGIIINLRSAHDENFSSRRQKANEKLKLFRSSKKIYYCEDYPEIAEGLKDPAFRKTEKISWSAREQKQKNIQLFVISKKGNARGTTITALYKKKKISLQIPFSDLASYENLIFCWLYLLDQGYENRWIEKSISKLNPVALRMEIKQGINQSTLINDSYNSDFESLSIALDLLNRQRQCPKKTLILSDIEQTGINPEELYKKVSHLLAVKKIHRFIGVGKEISRYKNLFPTPSVFFTDTKSLIEKIHELNFSHEAILIKGARNFHFESITEILQEKSHDTVFEINLNHLVHNLNFFRSFLSPDTKIMAMVKAFSYGSGSYEIASVLQHHRVDYFAVAYTDEGVELRKNGITAPIMVMNPEPGSFSDLLLYNLEPEIFSIRILSLFVSFISSAKNKSTPKIHLKIDTGMRRLGFENTDIKKLTEILLKHPSVQVASIFSHLVGSDNPALDEFTQQQIKSFRATAKKIYRSLRQKPLLHICNSSAVSKFQHAHFDMIRLGIGMYGLGGNEMEEKQLLDVGCWKTTISQIKEVAAGETVGYNRAGIAIKKTVIATVPVGYADGYSRRLSGGVGMMYIRGVAVKTIGNICMDMCMLDITELCEQMKWQPIHEGEEVIIFDSVERLKLLSKLSGTIPYEILTSISGRVKRVYITE